MYSVERPVFCMLSKYTKPISIQCINDNLIKILATLIKHYPQGLCATSANIIQDEVPNIKNIDSYVVKLEAGVHLIHLAFSNSDRMATRWPDLILNHQVHDRCMLEFAPYLFTCIVQHSCESFLRFNTRTKG